MPRPIAVVLGLVAGAASGHRLRRRVRTWGATAQESAARLLGDELLERADGVTTRAIEIDAPATSVWPWLVQMGPSPRGGAYTYDWIENLLGLNMHSVDRVLEEFQRPAIGTTIAFGSSRMQLQRLEPQRVLAWVSQDGNWVWTFVLTKQGNRTRLVSRNRYRLPTVTARMGMLVMEPASLIMERKMLYGIRLRAERLATAPSEPTAPHRSPAGERLPHADALAPERHPGPGTSSSQRPFGARGVE